MDRKSMHTRSIGWISVTMAPLFLAESSSGHIWHMFGSTSPQSSFAASRFALLPSHRSRQVPGVQNHHEAT